MFWTVFEMVLGFFGGILFVSMCVVVVIMLCILGYAYIETFVKK